MDWTMVWSLLGPVSVLVFSCIGAAVGCGIAGIASHSAMVQTDEGHGKIIGISAIPSSQVIYGFILMLKLHNSVVGGILSSVSSIIIGFGVGLVVLISATFQGMCAATAIRAIVCKSELFGKTVIILGIVESFALFSVVFSFLLM